MTPRFLSTRYLRRLNYLALKTAAIVAIAQPVAAQNEERAAAEIRDGMKPLAFFANSCWEGLTPDGQRTLTHCLRWIMGGKYLRDSLHLEGAKEPSGGETTYFWDLETKTIRYIYLSVVGAYSTGTVNIDGDKLIFDDERLVGRNGIVHFRTVFAPTGPDSYRQTRDRQGPDGIWAVSPASTYLRIPLP